MAVTPFSGCCETDPQSNSVMEHAASPGGPGDTATTTVNRIGRALYVIF